MRETEAENESNRATIQLNQLTAEAEASRGLLNSFLEGANQTWAGADVYDPDARILSPATVPQEASYPPRARCSAAHRRRRVGPGGCGRRGAGAVRHDLP